MVKWMLAAIVSGGLFGFLAPDAAPHVEIVSNIFIRLIKSVIAPVMFGVIVSSIATAPSMRELGRIGRRTVLYFEVNTAVALVLGWAAVAVAGPGVGFALTGAAAGEAPAVSFAGIVESAFPVSVFDAMARGDVLQIVVFSILFGVACHAVGGKASAIVRFAEAVREIAYRYAHYVMYLAPFAVFAAIAVIVARSGAKSIRSLLLFVAVAWTVQLAFLLIAQLGLVAARGVDIRRFIAHAREPFLIAFATTSSAAALPSTLECMERFGVPQRVVAIVTPISLSFNMTGSCIHMAMCACFAAQAAGRDLPLATVAAILLTLKLTSKGVAGIPRANFVILGGLFTTFGLPMEALTVLLGIDALIDPIRTSVNVTGHCVAAPVIASRATTA